MGENPYRIIDDHQQYQSGLVIQFFAEIEPHKRNEDEIPNYNPSQCQAAEHQ